jgi:hypothetical protein
MDRSSIEEELLGQGGLTRIGVADDRKRSAPGNLFGIHDDAS